MRNKKFLNKIFIFNHFAYRYCTFLETFYKTKENIRFFCIIFKHLNGEYKRNKH